MMEEKEYRQKVDHIFHKLGEAFDAVDPDVAEFEYSQGSVTILFGDKTRCILSQQPSVRQIWLAAASKGIAYHFDFNPNASQWMDDKGKGVELITYVKGLVKEVAGVDLKV